MLSLANVDLGQLVDELRQARFPELPIAPAACFVQHGTLACLVEAKGRRPQIYLHAVLNSEDVPLYVFRYVLTHELLHLAIPPREIKGRIKKHPPEFTERERLLAPEREKAWQWIYEVLGDRLQERPRLECLEVLPPGRPKLVNRS